MNVLVIEASGLHLGYLGCYGNDWVVTPHLNQLAAEGVTFDLHIADAIATTPPSCWTGRSLLPALNAPAPREPGPMLADFLEAAGGQFLQVGQRAPFGAGPAEGLAKLESLMESTGAALLHLA